nr:MAG TPA: hypothetical protein [Caudoviricetes sp.]
MKLTYFRDENKTVRSDVQPFDISFYKDTAYFINLENYVGFIKACERTIRKHPDYGNFVDSIRELKMEHCQVLGNISRYDAVIEMHHGPMLTLFDYCSIVVDHLLNEGHTINTFKIANIVLQEHYLEHVQVVMLSKTVHQLVDSGELFINLNQGIGNVNEFLKKFNKGLERYKSKINEYIDLSKKFKSHDSNILELEETMISWSYR